MNPLAFLAVAWLVLAATAVLAFLAGYEAEVRFGNRAATVVSQTVLLVGSVAAAILAWRLA